VDLIAGEHCRKASGGRYAKCSHRFADHIFAKHGTQCGAAITIARKPRRSRPFELDIATEAVDVHSLA
jgi:hypothetical protein